MSRISYGLAAPAETAGFRQHDSPADGGLHNEHEREMMERQADLTRLVREELAMLRGA